MNRRSDKTAQVALWSLVAGAASGVALGYWMNSEKGKKVVKETTDDASVWADGLSNSINKFAEEAKTVGADLMKQGEEFLRNKTFVTEEGEITKTPGDTEV